MRRSAFALVAVLMVLSSRASAQADRFEPGRRVVYKIDYANTSSSDLRALVGGDSVTTSKAARSPLVHHIVSRVRGALVETVISRRGDSVLVAYSIQDAAVELSMNGEVAAETEAAIRPALSKTFFAVMNSRGRIAAVRFDSTVNELAGSFARALLGSVQFVTGPGPDSRSWDTLESDVTGRHVVHYERTVSSGARRGYRKTKTRYLPDTAGRRKGDLPFAQTVSPGGSVDILIDASTGRIVSLRGAETQRVSVASKVIARGESNFTLQITSSESLNRQALNSLRDSAIVRERSDVELPLFGAYSDEADDTSIHRTELGAATIQDLLGELASQRSTDADPTRLYLKFKALVYLHPESSEQLGKVLHTAPANSPAMLTISNALATVGHDAAQRALARAIDARINDWPALATLIPALGGVRTPNDPAVTSILRLALGPDDRDITTTARLAAGIMARSLAIDHSQRSEAIVRALLNGLNRASSPTQKRDWLLALGNTGSATMLPAIRPLIIHADAPLRAAAVSAIRWVDGASVDSMLIRSLVSERDSTVRLAAATSLRARAMNRFTLNGQRRAFASETTSAVRVALLENLWIARSQFPEVSSIIKTAAADPMKPVRDAAARMR